MKLSLTIWDRLTLAFVFNLAPATERTQPGVLAIQGIQDKLSPTDKEKIDVGYVELPNGSATWVDEEHETEFNFVPAEGYYIEAALGWGGWPLSKNSNALWDKIEAAKKPKGKK